MRSVAVALAALIGGSCFGEPAYQYFITGSAQDVHTKPQPGILLAGGGQDVDAAFKWFLTKAAGGDVVVLRASGAGGYHPYFMKIAAVDSVETVVFRSAEASRDAFVLQRIRRADAIFIAGGDQWNYVRFWKDTPVEDAIHEAIRRGVPVGGTSAGLAVLGQFVFSAERDTVTSTEALADPFHPKITIGDGFLEIPQLRCLITDSHFSQRNRMGRLMIFMARIRNEKRCGKVLGLGVDERTAVLLEPDGNSRVVGEGSAYFLRLREKARRLKPGLPASLPPVEINAVAGGETFDTQSWSAATKNRPYKLTAVNGIIQSALLDGTLY
jgi:cyanophycinase